MRYRLFLAALTASMFAMMLAGCHTTTVIGPDPDFFRPDRCEGWPTKAQALPEPEYVLRGYQAYRCERDTRLAAGDALAKLSN